jgi:hypothetical protein
MAVYKSKKITGTDLNTLLTNLKKSRYFQYSNFIVNRSFYKSKKPYLKIKKVATS